MILIGQYDSPFVRRVGVALNLYKLAYEHRPWSTFGDAEKLRAYSPLMRVPVLVLEDGFSLIDSHLILDYIDSLVPEDQALVPMVEPARRQVLKLVGLATGLAEKVVSLFYERKLHEQTSPQWELRLQNQVAQALAVIEQERAGAAGPFWHGGRISHADIALTCALRHMRDSSPELFDAGLYPALVRHAAYFEAMPVFQTIAQPFSAPS